MAFDLEEQEKLDALKDWWKRYGTWLVSGLAVLAIAAGGWQWWQLQQRQKSVQAAELYGALQLALQADQRKAVKDTAAALIDQYPGTPYAPRAAMIAASGNVRAGDMKSAQAQLQWAIDHASEDSMKQLAVLRMAALLLEQKNPAGALKLLDAPYDEAHAARFNDLKGDAQALQNRPAEARASYRIALEKLDKDNPFRNYIQIKLDALGGETK